MEVHKFGTLLKKKIVATKTCLILNLKNLSKLTGSLSEGQQNKVIIKRKKKERLDKCFYMSLFFQYIYILCYRPSHWDLTATVCSAL